MSNIRSRKRGDSKRVYRKRVYRKRGGAPPYPYTSRKRNLTHAEKRTKRLIRISEEEDENEELKKELERDQSLQNIWYIVTNEKKITREEDRDKRENYDKIYGYSKKNQQNWKINMLRKRGINVTLINNKYVIIKDKDDPWFLSIINKVNLMNDDENKENEDLIRINEPSSIKQPFNYTEEKKYWLRNKLNKLNALRRFIPSFKFRRHSKSHKQQRPIISLPTSQSRQQPHQLPQQLSHQLQQQEQKRLPSTSQSHRRQSQSHQQRLHSRQQQSHNQKQLQTQPLQSFSEEELTTDHNISSWIQEQQQHLQKNFEEFTNPFTNPIKNFLKLGGKKRVPKETLQKKRVPKETLQKKRVPKETLQKKRVPKETLQKKRVSKETLQKKRVPKEKMN